MRTDRATLPAAALVATLALAACSGGPAGSPTTGPGSSGSPGPSATTSGDVIDHPTGATDVILRMEEGGGFVGPGFFMTQGPAFTLYGDGTVIWRDPADQPQVDPGPGTAGAPYRIARIDETAVQGLLKFAVADGALGIARLRYDPGNIADAGSTTFTLNAGGIRKTVDIVALGLGGTYDQSPDRPVIAQLTALRDMLAGFGTTVRGETWKADRYRGILIDDGFGNPIDWPWGDLAPADFVAPDPNTFGKWHTMTPIQVAALGVAGYWGGVRDVALRTTDGKLYGLNVRPLWPEETK